MCKVESYNFLEPTSRRCSGCNELIIGKCRYLKIQRINNPLLCERCFLKLKRSMDYALKEN